MGNTFSFSGLGIWNLFLKAMSVRERDSCNVDNGRLIAFGILPWSFSSCGSRTSGGLVLGNNG